MRIIHSLSGKRLDPIAVFALDAIYNRGEIRVQRPSMPPPPQPAPQPAPTVPHQPTAPQVAVAAVAAGNPSSE
jgi:hypothetical protein